MFSGTIVGSTAIGDVLEYFRNDSDKRNTGNARSMVLKKAFDTREVRI